MNGWLDELVVALGDQALSRDETGAILKLARDVAHGVERKYAPLAAFLVGVSVGRRTAGGQDRPGAFGEVLAAARGLVPEVPATGGPRGD